MIAVVQRVREAAVAVSGETVSRIGPGALVLLGVASGDAPADADWLARKIAGLRMFEGPSQPSLLETGEEALVVSQFTLLGDCRKGRRPSFTRAAPGPEADVLYEEFCERLAAAGVPVRRGVFGARMDVSLRNDGPFTLLVESPAKPVK